MNPSFPFGVVGLVLLTSVALSGCGAKSASGGSGGTTAGLDASPTGDGLGAVRGYVVDEEQLPIEGVEVGVRDEAAADKGILAKALTDADGAFLVPRLSPGSYLVVVQALGYAEQAKRAVVAADEVTEVGEVRLLRKAFIVPFSIVQTQRGFVGCGISAAGAGASVCGLVAYAGELVGVNLTGYDGFLLMWRFTDVPVSAWEDSVLEMAWTSNQALGRGLNLIWEMPSCCNIGELVGPSPLHVAATAKTIQKAIEDDGGCDASNCTMRSRVFTASETFGGPFPLVGVTYQQAFEQYLSAFFYAPAPPEYSAIPE